MSLNAARRWSTLLAPCLAVVALGIASGANPAAASARIRTLGLGGWQVQSSADVGQRGALVSTPGFHTGSWLHVTQDGAGAVGTEVGALVQNGRCPRVFYSSDMRRCFGYMNQVGRDTIRRFSVPWWFRTVFQAPHRPAQRVDLIVNGVVGEADVWVDGHRVATHATVQGDYTRYTFDITSLLRPGRNALALEVHPNDPSTMFTLDNVDWTQIPPDNNTGIQFPIQLHTAGPLAISDAHVLQHDSHGLTSARLTLKATVTNVTASHQTGRVTAQVRAPAGRGHRTWVLARAVTLHGASPVVSVFGWNVAAVTVPAA